ncbi:MAG TPA: sulfotransferase [Sphingomicrobium sp.]|nr:sulfotransferase [Sphingomicrobium sp.]
MKGPAAPSLAVRQRWLEQVDAAMRAQGLQTAGRLSLQALAAGVEHPTLLNLAASVRYGERRFEEAVQLLKRARALAPNDPHILNSLGVCLKALGRADEALQAYNAALRIDREMAPAHFNRGTLLEGLNDIKGGRTAYERAVALDPNYVEALASLAWLEAQAGDAAAARAHGERALALSPTNLLARIALASADLQQRDLSSAAARLSELGRIADLSPVNRSIVLGLIGDLNDAEGRPAEAFAAYSGSNAELKALNAARFEAPGMETALGHARRLTARFEAADPEPWREAPPQRPRAADPKAHIFLVGFPRSGTTLLENVLAAHPEVVSLEEKDCLAEASETYLASDEGLERLAQISRGEAMRYRDGYWTMVGSFGIEPRGRVFIDKMPLASVALPLIAKLFPSARVLFARRDPRDVVLSCFRRRFAMNPSMYQLLTLEGAAAYYDAVMRLSELYRERLPLPQHEVRYDSLVEDFEGTARAACGFIGLEWDEGMADFAAKARSRGISTPSAAQVARGLNREGQGAWRRYREQMAPVLPMLQPWVERFSYAED